MEHNTIRLREHGKDVLILEKNTDENMRFQEKNEQHCTANESSSVGYNICAGKQVFGDIIKSFAILVTLKGKAPERLLVCEESLNGTILKYYLYLYIETLTIFGITPEITEILLTIFRGIH